MAHGHHAGYARFEQVGRHTGIAAARSALCRLTGGKEHERGRFFRAFVEQRGEGSGRKTVRAHGAFVFEQQKAFAGMDVQPIGHVVFAVAAEMENVVARGVERLPQRPFRAVGDVVDFDAAVPEQRAECFGDLHLLVLVAQAARLAVGFRRGHHHQDAERTVARGPESRQFGFSAQRRAA